MHSQIGDAAAGQPQFRTFPLESTQLNRLPSEPASSADRRHHMEDA